MTTGSRQCLIIMPRRHALPLAGWDDYSVWGMDPMEATYGLFAQLRRNTDDADAAPRHWIMEVQDLPTLARRIAAVTGCTEDDAADAILVGVRQLEAEQGVRPDIAHLAVGAEHGIGMHPDDVIRRLMAEPNALPDRRVRLLCLGAADGRTEGTPLGCYLAEYDPEADDGRGSASWTPDPAKALAFESAEAAMMCYRTQPKTRPMRPDGKPNRPLTIFAITLH
jgi:hypothetical protein